MAWSRADRTASYVTLRTWARSVPAQDSRAGRASVYNAAVLAILTLAQTARMRWGKRALALAFAEYPCMRLTCRLMPYRPSSTRDTASAAP